MQEKFHQSQSSQEKTQLLYDAAKTLNHILYDKLFPYWYGTPWSFEGHTSVPNQGEIACGYFVSTLLEDAGFNLNRYKVAQQGAEQIVKILVSENQISRFRNLNLEEFVAAVILQGPGFYVVGLDFHIGFILHQNNEVFFIHSNYTYPFGVVKERALNSIALSNSNYYILGKITSNLELMTKWLEGKTFRILTQ